MSNLKDTIKLPVNNFERKSAINVSKIEYVELNANPILGCSHACKYCYARKIDLRFGRVKSNAEWHRSKIFTNYLELLKTEIEKGKVDSKKEIFISTMTDLYQPISIKEDLPRKLISIIMDAKLKFRILTKSPEIKKDADLFSGYKNGKIGLSITTDSKNEKVRKKWEPKTSSISKRLDALRELDKCGSINLWVSAEPFLPKTDFGNYYKEILEFGGKSLKEIIIGKMNYEVGIDKQFDWKSVVEISEQYRKKHQSKIRFHYKREFWNYLTKKELTPVALGIAKTNEFCFG